MLLGINFYLITLSVIYSNYLGQVYALCFLSLTAAETAVGLGLLITLYRIKGSVQFVELTGLKY
jgi:NADH-quinone oxidoreductase subunit K